MTKRKTFIAAGFITLGVLSLLLFFPVLISGGSGSGAGKGRFLLLLAAFGVGCLICGFALSAKQTGRPWFVLGIIFLMLIKMGADLFREVFRAPEKAGAVLFSFQPWIFLFLVYSAGHLLQKQNETEK